jgi:hypothetical protein
LTGAVKPNRYNLSAEEVAEMKIILGTFKDNADELAEFLEPRLGAKPEVSGGEISVGDDSIKKTVNTRHVKTYVKRFLWKKGERKNYRVLVEGKELRLIELEPSEAEKEEREKLEEKEKERAKKEEETAKKEAPAVKQEDTAPKEVEEAPKEEAKPEAPAEKEEEVKPAAPKETRKKARKPAAKKSAEKARPAASPET